MRLIDLLPQGARHVEASTEDAVHAAITQWVESRGLTLYPAQDEAILELVAGSNVILATPTGSGKSLVATAAMAAALARGECSVYTAPIKALVSEKFFDLCEIFGADNVGMITGDAAVNADAPIIAATAREVFVQTPKGHVEAALALGATRWEVVRMTVLPFGLSGYVSGSMLGLGRALGETMVVAMVLSPAALITIVLTGSQNPSTIAGNTSGGLGGGMSNLGVVTVQSSTIAKNTATSGSAIATGRVTAATRAKPWA